MARRRNPQPGRGRKAFPAWRGRGRPEEQADERPKTPKKKIHPRIFLSTLLGRGTPQSQVNVII